MMVFIALSVLKFQQLQVQQRDETADFIKKEIILCGKNIENAGADFEESVKLVFANRELSHFFEPDLQKLEVDNYNMYIINDIKKIRQFYSSNQVLISNIAIYNAHMSRVFCRNNNNYFSVTSPHHFAKHVSLVDKPTFIETDTAYYFVQPISNSKGELIANARFMLNIADFLSFNMEKFYIGKNSWSWVVDDQTILLHNYSEPEKHKRFETDALPFFAQKLKDNLSASLQHTIRYKDEINAYSVFYPVTILGGRFGIVFSVNTDTLYEKQNAANVQFFFYILVVIISIVLLFSTIIKQMRQAQKRLEATDTMLRQTNKASEILLTDPDFDHSMVAFLEMTAKALNYQRSFFMEIEGTPPNNTVRITHSWRDVVSVDSAFEVVPELNDGFQSGPYMDWFMALSRNTTLKFKLPDVAAPIDALMHQLNGKALVVIPVFVDMRFDGLVGFMDCRSDRQWNDVEDVFFANMANVLGGAVSNRNKKNELIEARDQAEKANNSKSEFLSRMSHELRTPMNAILGFSQLLEVGNLDVNQRKGVNHILSSGKHLLDLINEVLDITRIESGRLILSLESVSVNGTIREILGIVKPLAHDNMVKLEFERQDDLYVLADAQRLKQILINLVNNAIKYNVPYGTIFLKVERSTTNDSSVRISVQDTGIGINPSDIPRLFTPFERIGADQSMVEGTGLGLSVVKKLTEVMNGRVGVESTLGTGSLFWIELPVAEEPTDVAVEVVSTEHTVHQHKDGGTILYIEDNQSNIELVEQILAMQRPHHHLVTTMFGSKAEEMVLQLTPELVLLDLNLPDMHGEEVLAILKANPLTSQVPVIVISADAMPAQRARLLAAGAVDYLSKPIGVMNFLEVLDNILD
jgi:signal transduction histidine kinase/ActR/RegA family two-component response regulator